MIIIGKQNLTIFPGRYPPDPIQSSTFFKHGTITRLGTLWGIFQKKGKLRFPPRCKVRIVLNTKQYFKLGIYGA